MGCISNKQIKYAAKNMQLAQNEKFEASQMVRQIIISVQQLVTKLENIYDNTIKSNEEIPEHYVNLEPYQMLQKIRENEFLSEIEIKKIERCFRQILVQMKVSITKASQILLDFNQNNIISQTKKKILLEIVMLYESTCINFFKYQENNQYKKFIQKIQSKNPKELNEHSTSQQHTENIYQITLQTQDSID
ncbi:hypothetical protein ABPG72_021138 [Tetrahymena utriculariae]